MPAIVIPSAAQVKLRWLMSGNATINVFGGNGGGALTVDQTMANALDTAIKSALTSSGLLPLLHTTCSLVSVGIRSLNQANLVEFIGGGGAVAGTGTGDGMPRNTAAVVTMKTALAGRSFRGRVYIGGFNETQNEAGGQISTAAVNAAVAFVNAVNTALQAHNLNLAILSPALPARNNAQGVQLPAKPAFANNVISVTSRQALWGSQRRRTHRV